MTLFFYWRNEYRYSEIDNNKFDHINAVVNYFAESDKLFCDICIEKCEGNILEIEIEI